MANSTSRAFNVTVKKGPLCEIPARAKFQEIRSGVGLVLPKGLLQWHGITNTDQIYAEISPAENGYYVRIIHKEDMFP